MTVLRKENGQPLGTGLPPENEHLVTHTGIVSYAIGPAPAAPGAKLVSFKPSTGHNTAAYLPYRDNDITSIEIDNSVNRFFTDNLSGCSVFVDALPNGNLVVYHANVQGGAFRPSAEDALNARFERYLAIAVKTQFHAKARAARYAGAVTVGSLFKDRYNRNAARVANVSRFSGTPLQGMGTTVVGFRTGAGWEFWYQTWVQDATQRFSVQAAERFA